MERNMAGMSSGPETACVRFRQARPGSSKLRDRQFYDVEGGWNIRPLPLIYFLRIAVASSLEQSSVPTKPQILLSSGLKLLIRSPPALASSRS